MTITIIRSGKALAFTSYAETLSGSLHQLHIALHRACTTEAVPSVRLAAFKLLLLLLLLLLVYRGWVGPFF
ncbi:hypothetical protein PTSG_12467 [Salpingoeca rosetta]|uniref:Uncharacterized protein n=1 Tax=Salpingoeca rosetta (strain ATCC 50818 / BSB-021) TaxID=946362 RepID=F2UFP4_SALR5|nr:uncharacterized protein PTSG_12467 [Salpingoeca rosetta]EGD75612.1 hypothetical protein PTSG_12467 [Salpingoeca rosetta]|eukprot:XP_004992069.1 hypothetical protein PTSG_12467 [Salpingoeca rosetta]